MQRSLKKVQVVRLVRIVAVAGAALGLCRRVNAQTTRSATEPMVHQLPARLATVEVNVGQSRIIDAAWPVKRVTITDPAIADVDATSPRRITVAGKAAGVTQLIIENEQGEIWQATVDVNADVSGLQAQLRKMFDNSSLELSQAGDVLVLKGSLAKLEDAAQLRQYLQSAKLTYVDRTTVAGIQQVQLQVKIAEVSRTGLRFLSSDFAFGDGTASMAVNNGASGTYNPGTPPLNLLQRTLPGGTTIFGTGAIGAINFEYFLEALSDNQYLRVLAEPTLVARSGQSAHFLAGGQFPYPVAHVGGGSGTTDISIEYKDYGVQLHFTPTVLGNGMIELKVQPEVSQLSDVGAIMLQGTRIPAVLSRRVETTLELQSGQTFAIAGLINQQDNARTQKVPVLGDLPLLGTFFRSVRYNHDDTELLVLVTASLAEPSSTDLNPPLPGSFHQEPNDWELYVEGRLEGHAAAHVAPPQQERIKRLGLDQLRGPGAWASYENPPNNLSGEDSATAK